VAPAAIKTTEGYIVGSNIEVHADNQKNIVGDQGIV
jgi:hypothetical protein